MELLAKLEIYIPVEAEVKSIPMWSLPKAVLRRMGLPLSDSECSRKLTDSPEGIWICPVIIRMKGQKCASNTGNSVVEDMSSLLGKEFRAQSGPFQMSFVSANPTAYKVLRDTMPGKNVSTHTSHPPPLPLGSASQTYKHAVVIYHGHVYLSARRPSQRRSQRETRDPQPASQSSIPSASDLSSKSQKKHGSSEASTEPAGTKPKRKKLRVILPQTSSKQSKDLLMKKDHLSTTDWVLCVRVCMFYSTMCLAGWPLSSEAAKLRCGSDLLSDLIFVCGDRGIYLGKGTWSGYGARPRGKGIVDLCCRPAGCELQHLEMYCAKPKSQQHTTAYPATTTAPPTTTLAVTAQQFQAVFQKRLSEHLGPSNSLKREAYRRKTQPSLRRKNKVSSSRRRVKTRSTTSRPPLTPSSPLHRMMTFQS